MTTEFVAYKKGVNDCLDVQKVLPKEDRYVLMRDWYYADGREHFTKAFQRETGVTLKENRTDASRVEMGLPKTINDGAKKIKDNNFYAAHAEWFLQETDKIFSADKEFKAPKHDPYFSALTDILQKNLLDSLMVFEDFACWHQNVPNVFGIGKNRLEHSVSLYHAGLQAIYGTYSPLSCTDNHADTAISHLRMNIELRLRYGFGVLGLTDTKDNSFIPLGLSKLIESISENQSLINLAIPISHIDRIYRWSNLYIHGGFKLYTWCAPSALRYLQPFLTGGDYKTPTQSGWSVNAGIQASATSILSIQQKTLSNIHGEMKDPNRYQLDTLPPDQCQAILV